MSGFTVGEKGIMLVKVHTAAPIWILDKHFSLKINQKILMTTKKVLACFQKRENISSEQQFSGCSPLTDVRGEQPDCFELKVPLLEGKSNSNNHFLQSTTQQTLKQMEKNTPGATPVS